MLLSLYQHYTCATTIFNCFLKMSVFSNQLPPPVLKNPIIPIRFFVIPIRKKNPTLVLASKKWLVEQHLPQDASRSPHIHRSVTAAPEGFGQWIVLLRVQPGCTGWRGLCMKSHHGSRIVEKILSRNSRIHKIYHYLTTWQVFSDRLQPLLLGPSPYCRVTRVFVDS